MAALLVALSIMAVMMTVAMPVWKQTAQREKEEELVFRGMQYVHAIGMFQRKFANAYPPNVDVLVDQRFLRKKFKDPITNDDFVAIPVGTGLPGSGARGTATPGATNTGPAAGGRGIGIGTTTGSTTTAPAGGQAGRGGPTGLGSPPGGTGAQGGAGISGVTSKSKEASIRLYNGRSHYNEWAFVYTPQLQAGQGAAPGTAQPGQRSGQPGPPGQRGGPNDPFGGRGGGPGSSPFGPNPTGGRGGFGQPQQPILPPTRGRG